LWLCSKRTGARGIVKLSRHPTVSCHGLAARTTHLFANLLAHQVLRGSLRDVRRDKVGTEQLNSTLWNKLTDNKSLLARLREELEEKTRVAERARRVRAHLSAEKTAHNDVYATVVSRLSDRDQELELIAWVQPAALAHGIYPPSPLASRYTQTHAHTLAYAHTLKHYQSATCRDGPQFGQLLSLPTKPCKSTSAF